MPNNSIEPSADDFDVVKEYEHAALVSSTEERNVAFRSADEDDMPVMWITPRRKYADVEVDFITTPLECRGLNEAARIEAEKLNDYFLGRTIRKSKQHHHREVINAGAHSLFYMKGLHMDDAVGYSRMLAQIVFDEENWEIKPLR